MWSRTRRFIIILLIVLSSWWLFHPTAHAKRFAETFSQSIIVEAEAKPSNLQRLSKGKRIIIPIKKIITSDHNLLSAEQLVTDYRNKLRAAKPHHPVMLELHLENKNNSVDIVQAELVNISNLGKAYLRIDVKENSDFSVNFLTHQRRKLLIDSVVFS